MTELDVYYTLDGVIYVWNSEKAKENWRKHGIRFETACEVFHDLGVVYEDASVSSEERTAAIGYSAVGNLLFVVHRA